MIRLAGQGSSYLHAPVDNLLTTVEIRL